MTFLQALTLGVLQGLTEFLPVSSSGHLVLAETFFGLSVPAESLLAFDVLLHAGTLLALLVCYWKTWVRLLASLTNADRQSRQMIVFIIVATIPAVIAGLLFKDLIIENTRSIQSVAVALAVTGLILIVAEVCGSKCRKAPLSAKSALGIGCAQALALVPGISRSGITISTGQTLGLTRLEALDFSFLMAVPAIAGATVLIFIEMFQGAVVTLEPTLVTVGFLSSLVSSLIAILFLRWWVRRMALSWFAFYLIPASVLLLIW